MTTAAATALRPARSATAAHSRRPVAVWLFCVCVMLLVMISLGGATRLTGSGLSIMEWAPIMGTIPPLSAAEWDRLYALYQQIPQYALLNHGFGLDGFKSIFWLEWTHRLWGRLTGIVFIVPLIVFAIRGQISARLGLRFCFLLLLGGLQGLVGWFMVASGFDAGSTAVSAYRLVMHLMLALALYAAILWTALETWDPVRVTTTARVRRLLGTLCAAVALTIAAGGFVAGLKAGMIYNTFPLMGGSLVPDDYAALQPFLRNLTENLAAVQFDHRLLATLTALFALATVMAVWPRSGRTGRPALAAIATLVCLQYGIGVATLLLVVPVSLATLHQGMAILLLSATLVALYLHRGGTDSSAG